VSTEVTIPQLGESVTEGTITAWLVEVGQSVQADQPLFELSSDKIDTEVPAPATGVLQEIKVQVDETVDVGTVVAIIGDAGEGSSDGQANEEQAPADAGSAAAEPESAAPAAGGGDAQAAGSLEEREAVARDSDVADAKTDQAAGDGAAKETGGKEPSGVPAAAATAAGTPPRAPEPADDSGNGATSTEGLLASPIVRRMIAENQLDVSAIAPSGEGGRITREDVEAALSRRGEQPEPEPQAQPATRPQPERHVSLQPKERERVEDLSRIRQRIAAKMMESLQSAAQLTTVQEADVTRIMRLRAQVKDDFKAREGVSLSPFVFLCRAAVLTLRRPEHQNANAQADWQAAKVKYHDYVNLGIAVDSEKGLLVPNVKNADDLTLPALARAIAQAADKARGKGKLEMSDIEGGTFTVTNTGSRGVLIDTPILNYPEVAILGTGAIKKRPVVLSGEEGDAIAVRDMCYLSLTYDHRLLDGADAARFVTDVANVVENHDWAAELGLPG